jgi:hypothetical protein
VDRVFVYVHRLKSHQTDLRKATIHQTGWNHFELDRGEGKTMLVKLADFAANDVPTEADIAVVVDYRNFRLFCQIVPKIFPIRGDNRQWLKQPSADIQAEADQGIEIQTQSVPSAR